VNDIADGLIVVHQLSPALVSGIVDDYGHLCHMRSPQPLTAQRDVKPVSKRPWACPEMSFAGPVQAAIEVCERSMIGPSP
jgi:hypothetical protein